MSDIEDQYDDEQPQEQEKISVISSDKDFTSTTFQFYNEDHTLGNSLRYTIAKNNLVEYVGYSIPHPSEPLLNFRVQTVKNKSTVQALEDGLDNLIATCDHVLYAFKEEFGKGDYKVLEDERDAVCAEVARKLANAP